MSPADRFDGALSPENLLANTGWMHRLANSLVHNSARADDVVQSAWTALAQSPPRHASAIQSWLRTVVRNLGIRQLRDERRRTAREHAAASPEATDADPAALLQRAELQALIVDAVIALDEPYRSTVILRYFEGHAPSRIATAHGVPIATVWTRLNRALKRLRQSLDRQPTIGNQWRALLLPICASSASEAASAAAASSATGITITPQSTSLSTLITTWLGGAMSLKTSLACVAIVLLSCLSGVWIDRTVLTKQEDKADDRIERAEYDAAIASKNELAQQLSSKEDELRRLEATRVEQQDSMAALRTQVDALQTAASKVEEPTIPTTIAFGELAGLDEIRNANWTEMAEATLAINSLVASLFEPGGQADPETQKRIQLENAKLIKYYAGIAGKIPTSAPVNGEFTHPITTANLMSAVLDVSEQPLDAEQRQAFVRVGEDYERQYAEFQAGYNESTLTVEKLFDEFELKQRARERFESALSDEQLASLANDEVHGIAQIDTLGPGIMLAVSSKTVKFESREKLRENLPKHYAAQLGVDESALAPYAYVFDDYVRQVGSTLEGGTDLDDNLFTCAQAEAAGRAHVAALRELIDHLQLDDATMARIQANPGWMVPRVIPAK